MYPLEKCQLIQDCQLLKVGMAICRIFGSDSYQILTKNRIFHGLRILGILRGLRIFGLRIGKRYSKLRKVTVSKHFHHLNFLQKKFFFYDLSSIFYTL